MKCPLCGKEIKRKKGQNQKSYAYELQRGVHIQCQRTHQAILEKHHLSPNEYIGAVINGLFELFPEIRETKPMKDYDRRKKKAEEEIEEKFPFLKKKGGGEKEDDGKNIDPSDKSAV